MAEEAPGVYVGGRDGRPRLVHEYQDESYGLADIAELLQLGALAESDDGGVSLTLDRKALTDLRNLSHAFSFDYEEGFVEMCQDLCRAAAELPGDSVRFEERP